MTSNEELARRKAERAAQDDAKAQRDEEARKRQTERMAEQEEQRRRDRGQ